MYPLMILINRNLTMLCHGSCASLPHSRLPALIGLDQTETQDVDAWQNPPNAGREAPKEDRKASQGVDTFTAAETDQIHR
jgi:hypothetical protein